MNKPGNRFAYSVVASAVMTACMVPVVMAQEPDGAKEIEKIEVTATRRTGSLQEVPLNISAITADIMEDQNLEDLEDLARWVPGLTITNQGGRTDSPIIVRGLNTNSSGPSSDGGTVATYFGDVPLFLNMRLIDVNRVEVLIGPQGTLYGAGTLGGAIRYLPNEVEMDLTTGRVKGDVFSVAESDSMGGEASFVFNTPLIDDTLAIRAAVNYFNDPGYLDYNYVVRESGVSLPDPDWTDPTAVSENLKPVKDANGEKTLTGRVALRWTPNDWFDGTVSYFYQKREVEGRSITQYGALDPANPLNDVLGPYESAYRYEEPREQEDDLLSLELKADLGFAELVSATGWSGSEDIGNRDQTDLLIRLAYSYEEFPAFSAFTEEVGDIDRFTQEIRLVSEPSGPLSWIVGGFYYDTESFGYSKEFTPGFDEYALNVWGVGGNPRPDSLEYYSVDYTDVKEQALFGEVSYEVTDKLTVTAGLRAYEYEVKSRSAVDLPLFETVFLGRDPDSIVLDFGEEGADDSGTLFKFNASYQVTDDVLAYATVSEGFRIGGANGVAACPPDIDEIQNQIICALPDEQVYTADTTTNYELGLKTTFFKNKLHFNAAVFNVDWEDAQVGGATVNGQQPITTNAEGANSRGVELFTRAVLTDELTMYATYSYTKAELTADAPFLFNVYDEFDEDGNPTNLDELFDGKDGDRLPGSPEQQFSLGLTYTQEVFGDKMLDINYGITAQSDIITTVGQRRSGESLAGYAVSNLTAKISDFDWSVTFYVDNLFDKYAFVSTRAHQGYQGVGNIAINRTDLQRGYGHFLLRPRTVGVTFSYQFEM